MNSVILGIRLAAEKPSSESILQKHSWLLSLGTVHSDRDILAFAEPTAKKDASLGRIYGDLLPTTEGDFELELAVVLPDFLPNQDGQFEYYADVTENRQPQRLCVSNRMVKYQYAAEQGFFHVLAPTGPEFTLLGSGVNPIPPTAHVELQRTMVASRFRIQGSDAEEALSANLEQCMDSFVRYLNRLLAAHIMLRDEPTVITAPVYERNSFDYMYIAVQGRDAGRLGISRIASNLVKCVLNPTQLRPDDIESLRAYLSEDTSPDPAITFLRSAKVYLEGGVTSYALLLLAIAAETATSEYVRTRLRTLGVSNTKLRKYETDITFDQLLHIYLIALTPKAERPQDTLLGEIDRLKSLRNSVMHKGLVAPVGTAEVRKLYNAVRDYIGVLAGLSR